MISHHDSFDLEALKLDDFQKKAAYTEDTAIVTAGAGTGKTRALVAVFYILCSRKMWIQSVYWHSPLLVRQLPKCSRESNRH